MNQNAIDVPWPKIHKLDNLVKDSTEKVNVPLQENYSMEDMWYLDTPEAYPLFETQARLITERKYKNILDVGCRHGPVNKILHEDFDYIDYSYFGFDTSEEPIELASKTWKHYEHIKYECASWDNDIDVGFIPDVIIFSGVLLYIKDDNERAHFFDDIMLKNKCSNAIIQEPYHEQRYWDDRLILNTITNGGLDFLNDEYDINKYYLDLPVFAGKRMVYDVTSKS